MILKTGRKCKWEDIAVGEVFAIDGCWVIAYKNSDRTLVLIDSDDDFFHDSSLYFKEATLSTNGYYGKIVRYLIPHSEVRGEYFNYDYIYKLPLSVQRLWKEE